MANIKSAIKRAKQNNKRRVQNASIKSAMRTAIKKFEALVNNNEVEKAKEAFVIATKKIDKAAQKGLIHKNAAARHKSRLTKKLNSLTA
jgi:small subunit ribosomal protein S20